MIDNVTKSLCCGCEACLQTCPTHCIEMIADQEGFPLPKVDLNKCMDCGKCSKVCPAIVKTPKISPVAGYAYRTKDEELLRKTSSGGFFTAAAEKVLSRGGVVFGAAFNAKNEVVHTYIESPDELDSLRRSKYVQSRIGNTFVDCRRFLDAGRLVLFCGTPCQVKALNLFLGKKYDCLVTIDFVCHGVPSPGVFKRYLEELAHEKGGGINDLHEINFRAKNLGYSYSFAFAFAFAHYVENPHDNIFLRGFLHDVYLRLSCHNCQAKGFTSGSDYTMCDFWTVKKHMPDFPIGEVPGVNQVFVHSDKLRMFEQENAHAYIRKFDVEDSRLIQCWAMRSVPLTWRRQMFFSMLEQGQLSLSEIILKVLRRKPVEVVNGFIKRFVGRILSGIGLR